MGEEHLESPRPNDAAASHLDGASAVIAPNVLPARPGHETSPTEEAAAAPESKGEHGEPTEEAPEGERPAEASRRALKLVLHLQPTGAAGYRALLALGADGCDPLLRVAEVASLTAALDAVPGFVAEAESRWQTRPRYPASAKARPAAAPSRAKAAQSAPAASEARESTADASAAKPLAQPPPKSAPAGQLSLFG